MEKQLLYQVHCSVKNWWINYKVCVGYEHLELIFEILN